MGKTTVRGLKGKKQTARAVYDFDKDTGAQASVDLFDLKAGTIIHNMWYEVETPATSAGAATLEVGEAGDDTDGYFTQALATSYAANKVSGDAAKGAYLAAGLRKKVLADLAISLLIGTADLTAGKIHFYCEFSDGY